MGRRGLQEVDRAVQEIWLLCLMGVPELGMTVLGAYTSEEKMFEVLRTLPRENPYNMYRVPLDQFLGYWHKGTGKLLDGMGRLDHCHFFPPDEESQSGWSLVDRKRDE